MRGTHQPGPAALAGARVCVWACLAAAAAQAAPAVSPRAWAADGGVPLPPARTSVVTATLDVGAPVERAVPGRAYALAVAKDREQRWGEAAALYQQAAAEWSAALRTHPTPALEHALQKAERERQRSQLLAGMQPPRGRAEGIAMRVNPLDAARLYRTKLMVVRAFTGSVPAGLYARARDAFEEALRGAGAAPGPGGRPVEGEAEIHLLLCATHAAAGDGRAARLARARVADADRVHPTNALPMAVCAAALGEDALALSHLELYVLGPPAPHVDAFTLRDLYVANDWDHLRGARRFETLFR